MEIFQSDEILLDTPRTNEPIEDAYTSSFIIRSTRACTTKRLLTNDGTCAFFVVVDVSGCVPKGIGRGDESFTLRCEAGVICVH